MTLVDRHVVVVITGISAAGKSTVAELLARRFNRGVHVRGDVFRRMVVSGREEMTAVPSVEALHQLRLRYRLAARTADAYHEEGFSVVVQDVVLGADLTRFIGTVRARPLVVVVLVPSAEEVARRETERAKTAYREGGISVADLDRALRAETPRIGLWLDTSELTAAATVDAIVARGLDEGLVE